KSGSNQIWFGKEFSNGIALAAAFTFIISLCAVLMKTPFFATLKAGTAKAKTPEDASPANGLDGNAGNAVMSAVGGAK
ncbi:hypothetical protein DK853_43465, partial [Klebsiella oxytoca]